MMRSRRTQKRLPMVPASVGCFFGSSLGAAATLLSSSFGASGAQALLVSYKLIPIIVIACGFVGTKVALNALTAKRTRERKRRSHA